MRVNIYYGGRGLVDDPTLGVIGKLTGVLEELRVEVRRFNLYEERTGIIKLPNTLKDAEAAILAVTVEWLGIGGYMQQFLDACWLYGDKEVIKRQFMMPVVTASTYGEREAETQLMRSWNILGGSLCDGICAYVQEPIEFELNNAFKSLIEKKAENLYRMINQRTAVFPSSEGVIREKLMSGTILPLTPQESEQLTEYLSKDDNVKQQKEDVEELAQIYRGMLGSLGDDTEYIRNFRTHFHPVEGFHASYMIVISDYGKSMVLEVNENDLKCYYGEKEDADVKARTSQKIMNDLVTGQTTIQRAFMEGSLAAKGDFKNLRHFDTIFQFHKL